MRLTRKDYEAIADAILAARAEVEEAETRLLFRDLPDHASLLVQLEQWAIDMVASSIAYLFEATSPRFRRATFLNAAGNRGDRAAAVFHAVEAAKREAQGQTEAAPADIPISGPVGNRPPAVPDWLIAHSRRPPGEDVQRMRERMCTAFISEELNALFPTYPFPATQLVDVGDLADTSRTTLLRYHSHDPNEERLAELDEAMRPTRVDPF